MKVKSASKVITSTCLTLLAFAFANLRAAVFTVSNTSDNGSGSLRQALGSAADGDTIDATGVSGTITLTTGTLAVSNSVNILGPGPARLTVSGNYSFGVLYVVGTNVTISGITIANGMTNFGAGIYSGGSTLTVSNCTLSGNGSISVNGGGGIYNSGATLSVTACIFSGNSAFEGGGIYNDGSVVVSTTVVNACTFKSNAAGWEGGGIFNAGDVSGGPYYEGETYGVGYLSMNASTFSSNSSVLDGGAIYNYGGVAYVNASTFNGNSGSVSGNIYSSIANEGPDVISFSVTPLTVSSNWAGLYLEIGDCILNAGGPYPTITNYYATLVSDGYNLASDNGSGYLTATGDVINTDPKLGPLQNNGGPTMTHALLAGSPAIDQGNRNAVAGLDSNTDQRGFPRPVDNPSINNASGGDGSDIGAYEVEFSALDLQVQNITGQPGQKNLVFTPWATGWTYSLQYTTNIFATSFAPLTGFSGPTTNGNQVLCTDLNATQPQKFYRLQLSPPSP